MFRWVDHTAELELELEAPSQETVFEEALAAFAELAGGAGGAARTREIEVHADEPALLLAEWLDELVYLGEAESFLPERVAELELADGSVRASVEGRTGEPRQLVKAVTLHRLELGRDRDGIWRGRVVLDV